jgi:hypothetical protein
VRQVRPWPCAGPPAVASSPSAPTTTSSRSKTVEGNCRIDLISTACPIWWEMNVVIYMPKCQQGSELNK